MMASMDDPYAQNTYWLVSLPLDAHTSKEAAWSKLNDKTALEQDLSANYKFPLPVRTTDTGQKRMHACVHTHTERERERRVRSSCVHKWGGISIGLEFVREKRRARTAADMYVCMYVCMYNRTCE